MSDDFQKMSIAVKELAKERDWEKFQTPKNMAMCLSKEAGEVLEHFIWANNEEIIKDKKRLEKIAEELGDVLQSLIVLSNVLELDLEKSFWDKIDKTKKRYPVEKVYGVSGYEVKSKE